MILRMALAMGIVTADNAQQFIDESVIEELKREGFFKKICRDDVEAWT
jgi:hypothetical protein